MSDFQRRQQQWLSFMSFMMGESLQEQKILEEEDKSRSQELERVEVRVEMESQSGDFTGNTLIKVHGCS